VITHAKGSKVAQELTADRALVEKRLAEALEQQTELRANTTGQMDEVFFRSIRASSTKEYRHMARIYDTRVNRRVTSMMRTMIRELGARASANGVTIYTLQPDFAGAVKVSGGGADVGRGRSSPQGQSFGAGTFAVDQFHRSVVAETRDALQTLADDTGGKFFV